MKNLTTLILLFPLFLNATNYYVSATGKDSNNGTSEATAWATLGKVNSASLGSGDVVSFNRGDTWQGSLTAKSGVTYTAYGTGNNPLITGLYTVTGWTQTNNGNYEASIPSGLATCNIVILDGNYQPMGRYPKSGYIIATGGSTTSVNGPLSGVPSFTGGEIVWRPYHWVLWRGTVNSQSSSSVSFTGFPATSGGSVYPAKSGYGFFFQNHPNACTAVGDWSYSNKKLTMNFGSAGPGAHTVQVPTVETIISVTGNSAKFNGLTVAGGNSYGIQTGNSASGSITSCDIMYSGIYGINAFTPSVNWSVTNCNIVWSGSNAIGNAIGLSGWVITGNTIRNTGSIAGMGGSGEGQYFGIINSKNTSKVEGNIILNTGYNAICFQGTNNSIKNNFIDTFCTVKDDGGGIYAGGQNYSGTVVEGNIVLHGIGAAAGTPDNDGRTHGFYMDDKGNNTEVRGNTFAYNDGGGINLHDAFSMNIHDNINFDNKKASIVYYNDGNTIAGISLNKNIFFAKGSQYVHRSSGGSASPATFFTTADNNYWCRPSNENADFSCLVPNRTDNLATWKTFTGKEANSKTTPAGGSNAILIYNETDMVRAVPSGYVDLFGASTVIQPHSSLIVIPGTTPPPQVFKNITASKAFTKNNCTSGTGTSVTYIVAAGKYSATTQAAADQLATNDINANGQNWANLNGTCTPKTIIRIEIFYSDGTKVIQQ